MPTSSHKQRVRQRARRDTRAEQPQPMRLTKRDLDILQAVGEYRVLTTQQLKMLFFPSLHQAYARLALLYQHGYLERKFLGVYADKMNTPILYLLDKRGAETLAAQRGIEAGWSKSGTQVSTQFLEHTLAINMVRIAITKACDQQPGFALLEWRGENELKAAYDRVSIPTASGRLKAVSLIPDSYFILNTPQGRAHFCLELDRGTMTTKRFATKVLAYQAYYQGGGYQRRYGTKSLRVLTVTLSSARLENLRRATEQASGKQRFWFAILDQLTPETVLTAPVWQVATLHTRQPLVAQGQDL